MYLADQVHSRSPGQASALPPAAHGLLGSRLPSGIPAMGITLQGNVLYLGPQPYNFDGPNHLPAHVQESLLAVVPQLAQQVTLFGHQLCNLARQNDH